MGCLVVSLAILEKHIPGNLLRSAVFVAPPFLGAPAAFSALYDTGYLPGFDLVERFSSFGRDRLTRISNMLEACQTFPSIYQLLPPLWNDYLHLDAEKAINPLGKEDDIIQETVKEAAKAVHLTLTQLPSFLVSNRIQHAIISGITSSRKVKLKFEHLPEARHSLNPKYPLTTISQISAARGFNLHGHKMYTSVATERLAEGDGTVPLTSGMN